MLPMAPDTVASVTRFTNQRHSAEGRYAEARVPLLHARFHPHRGTTHRGLKHSDRSFTIPNQAVLPGLTLPQALRVDPDEPLEHCRIRLSQRRRVRSSLQAAFPLEACHQSSRGGHPVTLLSRTMLASRGSTNQVHNHQSHGNTPS